MMMANVNDKASGTSARHFHNVLRNGNDDSNYGNDDNECQQQGLVHEHTTYSLRVARWRRRQGASARHFHIALRSGNDDNNNYWQQRTTSVGRQDLVRERTTCGAA